MQDRTKLLYAITGNHYLLDNNKPKLIGKAYCAKRYLSDETATLQEVVFFNYGDERIQDSFLFEDGHLVYHSVSLYTDGFLVELYKDLMKQKITTENFIAAITQEYTFRMMGFMD